MRVEQMSAAGGYAEGDDGTFYPTVGTFRVDDGSLPYVITVEMGLVAGKPVCRKLTAQQREGGMPVTRRGLNAVPVSQIVETISQRFGLQFEDRHGKLLARHSTDQEKARITRALRPARGRPRDPDSRRRLVEEVAALYQELVDQQVSHPKPTIARKLGYSTSYVGALIAEARKTKPPLLGKPAGPGRAGSLKPTKRAKRESHG